MVDKKIRTRVVHSKKLKDYLVASDFEPVEVIDNPFKVGFNSWVFEVTQELNQAIDLYYADSMDYKELCVFIQEEAKNGVIYTMQDLAPNVKSDKVEYKVNHKKHIVFRLRKKVIQDER